MEIIPKPGGSTDTQNGRQKASYQAVIMSSNSLSEKINWDSSYITQEWIERAGIYRVDHETGATLVGKKTRGGERYYGIAIPYYWPGRPNVREYRLRRDVPDYEQDLDGSRKEKNKYLSPPGRGNYAYFPPGTESDWLTDSSVECFIVEGEKKALALRRYFEEINRPILIVALPGVWNFRGKIGITLGPQGERVPLKGVIGDIESITWRGRTIKILFDANAATNPSVNHARRELAKELIRRGGMVRLLDLEVEEGINGVDDFLGKHGPAAFTKFLAEAIDGKNLQGVAAFPLTDIGNAERLIARHGHNLKWSESRKSWFCWDEKRWKRDECLQVEQWAKDTVRAIPLVEGPVAEDGDDLLVYARKCESNDKVKSMLSRARAENGIPTTFESFDADPYLLNCLNGTLDLKTGELRKHNREDLLTKLCPINYDDKAKAPRWEQFLGEIFDDDQELIDFIGQTVGYSLTGDISAQCMFVLHGSGANGKSKLINTVQALLGEYGEHTPIETFMLRNNNNMSNDLARLRGARIVTASETNEGQRLNESLIKQVTGGDPITARFLREEFFTFKPAFKLWFSVNHKPNISGTDYGMWRRVRLIPFSQNFPIGDPRRDDHLQDKLNAELPGILSWAVRGCQDWLRNGFKIPDAVKSATEEYQRESDSVGEFIYERCITGTDYYVKAGDLYQAYTKWAESQGVKAINSTLFGRRLSNKGFQATHGRNGQVRQGVGLLESVTGCDGFVTG